MECSYNENCLCPRITVFSSNICRSLPNNIQAEWRPLYFLEDLVASLCWRAEWGIPHVPVLTLGLCRDGLYRSWSVQVSAAGFLSKGPHRQAAGETKTREWKKEQVTPSPAGRRLEQTFFFFFQRRHTSATHGMYLGNKMSFHIH